MNIYSTEFYHLTTEFVHKGCSNTSFATPTSSANAMYYKKQQGYSKQSNIEQPTIILNISRHIVVDDMLNIGKIKSFSCYVSCHKNIFPLLLELLDCPLSLFLICGGENT